MQILLQDLMFAWRQALKRRANTALIILTLALGIGVNAAMSGAAYQMLLAPLPFADEERLVRIEQNGLEYYPVDGPWSDPTRLDIAAQQTSFSQLNHYTQGFFTLVGQGEPYLAYTGIVSADFFTMLGADMLLGRNFESRDDTEGAEAVLLLSHEFWLARFGGDPGVIGRELKMYDINYRVIGVLPPMPPWPHANDVWIPAASDPFRIYDMLDVTTNRANGYILQLIGKLHEGISAAQASSDLRTIATRLASEYPDVYTREYSLTPRLVRQEMAGNSATLLLLPALALLVLLIAIANVANLQLANLLTRGQELAVREALGASPVRIRHQLLTESLLLALCASALALTIAGPSLSWLSDYAAGFTPLAQRVDMDFSIVLLTLLLGLGSGALSAMFASVSSRDINRALKEGGDKVTASTEGVRRRQLLLIAQFALGFVVLTGSGLIVASLYRLNQQDFGFEPEGVLQLSMLRTLAPTVAPEEAEARGLHFWQQLRARVNALPGVQASGYLNGAPVLENANWLRDAAMELVDPSSAALPQTLDTGLRYASEDYFATLEIPLLKGRMFEAADASGDRVALINAALAERYFPGGDPLGKRIRFPGGTNGWTIVGVVGNVRGNRLDREEEPAFYLYQQIPNAVLNLYVRSSGDLRQLADTVTAIVHEIEPEQSVRSALPLADVRSRWLAPTRLRGMLTLIFSLMALVVTLSGVVGVVSCNITRQVREIGIHMALGGSPRRITSIFLLQGLKAYLCGITLGLLLALASARLLEPMLYETSAFSPAIYATVLVLLTLVVLLAIYFPARKAGRRTPLEALHGQ